MKKRLFSLILAFVLFSSLMNTPVNAVAADTVPGLVETLGIINSDVDKPGDYVTRELAAVYVARMLNMDVTKTSDLRYYIDVEHNGFSATAINNLVDLNILSVGDDHLFNPEKNITVNEIAKMLVCAAGYNVYAELEGGYPSGYVVTAKQLGIDLNVADIQRITVAEVGRMINDALRTQVHKVTGINSDGNIEFSSDPNNTLLSFYWNIQESEGNVQSVYGGSVNRVNYVTSENSVIINGAEYTVASDIEFFQFLGSNVRFYYKKVLNGLPEEIIYAESKSRVEDIVINIDDFIGYTNETLTYYGMNNKTKKETLLDPVILYNGAFIGTGIQDMFSNLNKGEIVLKDCDNDSTYDLISISDYQNVVVSSVDYNKENIYNKLSTTQTIQLEEYDNIRIFDENRNALQLSDITNGQILSVAASKDKRFIELVLCNTVFTGVATLANENNGMFEVIINGALYNVDKTYLSEFKNVYSLGESLSYTLDHLKKIVYVSEKNDTSSLYGYLIKPILAEDEVLKFKMLKHTGEVELVECYERILIDGISFKNTKFNEAVAKLSDANGFLPQLVKYELKEDKLFKIDTATVESNNGENENNSLFDIFHSDKAEKAVQTGNPVEYMSGVWFNSNNFGRKCVVKASTPVFFVPYRNEEYTDESFGVKTVNSVFESDSSYSINAYQSSALNAYADVIVFYVSSSYFTTGENTNKMMVVNEVKQIYENEELYDVVEGFRGGAAVTQKISSDSGISLDNLHRGDIIMFATDYSGRVVYYTGTQYGYKVIYEHSKNGPIATDKWKDNNASGYRLYNSSTEANWNYWSVFQISFGNVMKKIDNIVQWSSYGFDEYEEVADLTGIPIVVYDEMFDEVRTGSINDVLDYESVGEDCSRILYFTQRGAGKLAVVYNYE